MSLKFAQGTLGKFNGIPVYKYNRTEDVIAERERDENALDGAYAAVVSVNVLLNDKWLKCGELEHLGSGRYHVEDCRPHAIAWPWKQKVKEMKPSDVKVNLPEGSLTIDSIAAGIHSLAESVYSKKVEIGSFEF